MSQASPSVIPSVAMSQASPSVIPSVAPQRGVEEPPRSSRLVERCDRQARWLSLDSAPSRYARDDRLAAAVRCAGGFYFAHLHNLEDREGAAVAGAAEVLGGFAAAEEFHAALRATQDVALG